MVKSADTADLKSAGLNRPWGFKSPSGHHKSRACRVWFSSASPCFRMGDAFGDQSGRESLGVQVILIQPL